MECGCEVRAGTAIFNWISLDEEDRLMKSLTQYGCLAGKHWRQFLPRMVAELERRGRLSEMLREAEEQTTIEMDELRRRLLLKCGLSAQQAEQRAWEMVRERYVLLPPESWRSFARRMLWISMPTPCFTSSPLAERPSAR